MEKEAESTALDDMENSIVTMFINSAIREGIIITEGLTEEEVRTAARKYLEECLETDFEIVMTIYHKDTLLNEARNYASKNNEELSIVMYATWWEHWINGLIEIKTREKNLTKKEYKQLISSINNNAKTSWLLKLIDLPPFDKDHLNIMGKLAEKRNSFIHYKYPFLNEADDDSLDNFFKEVEKSITYFISYESENIDKDKKYIEKW
ncbi:MULTISPECIES: hypothetical protein [unclassified Photobacterium]|uniref:hypothetical protein n=1 Tax=unclassified Photobacterium TaxID=2628852 RepID=UPI001EDF6608|nr:MULTISPECIES: hypothetical protein [unclassified Photobacterium]MCG3865997.1 hypothetical protein [Photobacterium sp. Ph6]MCG3877498.1 hypothetical protein [Photobacterium sp. Ph5]